MAFIGKFTKLLFFGGDFFKFSLAIFYFLFNVEYINRKNLILQHFQFMNLNLLLTQKSTILCNFNLILSSVPDQLFIHSLNLNYTDYFIFADNNSQG